jgi:hypothetical protein
VSQFSLDPARFDAFQLAFHQRFHDLQDPDVRALAWILTAPDLFDPAVWQGRVGSVPQIDDLDGWLRQQDGAPHKLKQGISPGLRLGRYAEHLMAHYLREQGWLEVQGLQVRASKEQTIGEFDFLWHDGPALVHWEFATKFYLYHADLSQTADSGYFIGPNLADSLSAKMGKILHRQLALATHPAAQALLPRPIDRAQALVKGWLFYPPERTLPELGLSADHCRGFWCSVQDFAAVSGQYFALLPRMRWLAPARMTAPEVLERGQLQAQFARHFASDSMPLLVVCLDAVGQDMIEARRGFVVPDDWQQRAALRQADTRHSDAHAMAQPVKTG